MWKGRRPDELTAREREVLRLVRLGLTNEEIASRLGVTVAGAKYHVSQILSKLGVATREEAAAWRPEPQRAGYLKWALISGLGAIGAIAASAFVLAVPHGGNDVQLESQVLAGESDVKATASSSSSVSTSRPMPLATPARPTASSQITLATTAATDLYLDPENASEATPTPSAEPTPTTESFETPRPMVCACSGIQGRATQSPVLPPGSSPAPYQATIAIWNADRTQQVLEFTTDPHGKFRVMLPEGQYYIDPQGPAEPLGVTVPANGFVAVTIDYDTGIR